MPDIQPKHDWPPVKSKFAHLPEGANRNRGRLCRRCGKAYNYAWSPFCGKGVTGAESAPQS